MSSPDPVGDALRLRASDADRERVAGLLRDAYVEGRLCPIEYDERRAGVPGDDLGDLVPLLEGLPVAPGALAVAVAGQVVAVTAPEGGRSAGGVVLLDPGPADEGQRHAAANFPRRRAHRRVGGAPGS
jgi:hypothetical protein